MKNLFSTISKRQVESVREEELNSLWLRMEEMTGGRGRRRGDCGWNGGN
jgi:hypothetical protein